MKDVITNRKYLKNIREKYLSAHKKLSEFVVKNNDVSKPSIDYFIQMEDLLKVVGRLESEHSMFSIGRAFVQMNSFRESKRIIMPFCNEDMWDQWIQDSEPYIGSEKNHKLLMFLQPENPSHLTQLMQ